MPEQPSGFYVQTLDASLVWLETGTPFSVLATTDSDAFAAVAHTDEHEVPLFIGTEAECRDYLSHLIMNMLQVGIPAVPTQQIVQAQRPNPEDQKRWGGGSRK